MNIIFVPPNVTPGPINVFISALMNFTSIPINVTPSPANVFSLILPIYQSIINLVSAQIGPILPADLLQQPFYIFANFYIQIPFIRMSNKILPATIIA